MVVELKPHQQVAVDQMGNGKILRGDPGVGKSFTALAYFYEKECGGVLNDFTSIKRPRHLFIITTAKKRNDNDWQTDCYKLGLMEDPLISVAGIKVTVDSWNNIEKYKEVKDAFFIFDEQKVVGSGLWAKSFVEIAKHNRWILLSATPGDVWMDYVPVFLANGFYKNRTEFKTLHVVYSAWTKFPKVERYIRVPRLVHHRDSILVEMHYERHTVRKVDWINVAYDIQALEQVTKRRWHIYEERPIRDVAEMFALSRKVVNSDCSRLEKVKELQKKHKRIIVFYNFDYELEILRTLADEEEPCETLSRTTSTETRSSSTSSRSGLLPSKTSDGSDRSTTTLIPGSPDSESGSRSTTSSTSSETAQTAQSRLSEFAARRPRVAFSETLATSVPLDSGSDDTVSEPFERSKTTSPAASEKRWSKNSEQPKVCLTVAEWNGHKHQPVPTTKEWVYLVQYRAGAEAWNCITTDAMVFYSQTYSYKDFEQSQGRIDRMNSPFTNLQYYVLYSESWIDEAVKKSLMAKQDFNERRLQKRIEAHQIAEEMVEDMMEMIAA